MTTSLNTVEAKEQFTTLINRVAHNKEQIILTRRGKDIAALVPIEDFQLLLDSRDKSDLHEAIEALKEARDSGMVTLEEIKEDLGT